MKIVFTKCGAIKTNANNIHVVLYKAAKTTRYIKHFNDMKLKA